MHAGAFLLSALFVAGGDDPGDALSKAKAAYEEQAKRSRDGVLALLRKREDDARASADPNAVRQARDDRVAFEVFGEPPTAGSVARTKEAKAARARLEAAYQSAAKALVQAGRSSEADAIGRDLEAFRRRAAGDVGPWSWGDLLADRHKTHWHKAPAATTSSWSWPGTIDGRSAGKRPGGFLVFEPLKAGDVGLRAAGTATGTAALFLRGTPPPTPRGYLVALADGLQGKPPGSLFLLGDGKAGPKLLAAAKDVGVRSGQPFEVEVRAANGRILVAFNQTLVLDHTDKEGPGSGGIAVGTGKSGSVRLSRLEAGVPEPPPPTLSPEAQRIAERLGDDERAYYVVALHRKAGGTSYGVPRLYGLFDRRWRTATTISRFLAGGNDGAWDKVGVFPATPSGLEQALLKVRTVAERNRQDLRNAARHEADEHAKLIARAGVNRGSMGALTATPLPANVFHHFGSPFLYAPGVSVRVEAGK